MPELIAGPDLNDEQPIVGALSAAAVEQDPNPILWFDDGGFVTYANRAALDFFGLGSASRVVGRSLSQTNPAIPIVFSEIWREVLVTGRVDGEFMLRNQRAGRIVGYSVNLVSVAGQKYGVMVMQDVTESRKLEQELLQVLSDERRRLGQDIHDGVGQQLTGLNFVLAGLRNRLISEQATVPRELDTITTLLETVHQQVRLLGQSVFPLAFETGGFSAALEQLALAFSQLYRVPVDTRLSDMPLGLDRNRATNVYFLVSEAVTNAAKHANATSILIDTHESGESVHVTVEDNGSGLAGGFDRTTGLGMRIMEHRARAAGGTLQISSGKNGTLVTCTLPSTPNRAAVQQHV